MSDLLDIGVSALTTNQVALATTSNNISNVNTEGYSRQRTEQVTYPPNFQGTHYTGSGVTVGSVGRVFDSFLAGQVRLYTAQQSQQQTFLDYSKQVDDLLGSSELGINNGLEDFFNATQAVANDPTSIPARQVLISQGESTANRFNTIDKQLSGYDQQINSTISAAVGDINTLSKGIADLNHTIVAAETATGTQPNDLLDQRDGLINKLSKYVSVNTLKQDDGATNVFIGNGQALVVGTTTSELSAISDNSSSLPRLSIGFGPSPTDISAQLSGGSLGGALQVRQDIIDPVRTQMDTLAKSLVTAVNTVHANGVDLDGNAGGDFFDPASTTAGTINVSLSNPRNVAASSATNTGIGNNENALALADLQTDKTTVVVNPGPPAQTRSFAEQFSSTVADVATRTHQAKIGEQTQQGLLDQVSQRYASTSGVNLDEEAANLIKYQQAYQAASQIITVSNTIFDSLIRAI